VKLRRRNGNYAAKHLRAIAWAGVADFKCDFDQAARVSGSRFLRTLPNSHRRAPNAFGRADNVAAIQFVQHFVPAARIEIVSD
jgi:hypothetical protein